MFQVLWSHLYLNNKADQQGIRKDTQEKVLMLARQMGYFESLQEKNETSPVEEKPGVLGMIVPSLNDPFVIQITPFPSESIFKYRCRILNSNKGS